MCYPEITGIAIFAWGGRMFPGRFFSIRVTIIIVLVLFVSFGCKEPDSVIETAEYRISANGDSAILKSVTTTLSEYTVPESVLIDGIEYPVEEIGASAFSGQTSIERLYLPSSLKKIGGNAFYGCSSLILLEIPDGVTTLEWILFSNCISLKSITIPSSVTEVGSDLFYGCECLESINVSWPGGFQPSSWDDDWLGDIDTNILDITILDIVEELYWGGADYRYSDTYGGYIMERTDYFIDSIPNVINGIPVVGLGNDVFSNMTGVAYYDVPEFIKVIGDRAFQNTPILRITLPESVEILGEDVFSGCSALLNVYVSWGDMNTPEGWDGGWRNGFFNVYSGDDVIQYIYHDSLISYDSSIDGYRVCGHRDKNVREIEFPYDMNILKIDDEVFSGYASLEYVRLPETLVAIGERAFAGCVSIESIEIPSSVTEMGTGVFDGCSALNRIMINSWEKNERPSGWNADWKGNTPASEELYFRVIFNLCNGEAQIVESVLSGEYVEAPDPVRSGYFFDGWYMDENYETEFNLSDPVVSNLNLYAKWSDEYVATYTVAFSYYPLDMATLYVDVKEGEVVEFPQDPEHEIATFTGWYDLATGEKFDPETHIKKDYHLRAGWSGVFTDSYFTYTLVQDLKSFAASITDEIPSEIVVPISFKELPVSAVDFSDIDEAITVMIPEGATSNIFFGDTVVEKLKIPGTFDLYNNWYSVDFRILEILEGSETVSVGLFYSCDSLKELILPDGLKTIERNAFYDCANLSSVNFPSTLSTIEESAFRGCGFTEIVLPRTIETIGYYAFDDCPITKVTAPGDASFSVAFPNAEIWDVSEDTKKIADYIDRAITVKNAKVINLPDGLENIGLRAFLGFNDLESIKIPESVKEIGEEAFYGCSSLRNAEIRADINEIPVSLFAGCTVLESVTIPKTVKKIGDEAFSGCSSLETVTLPTSLEIIGDSAFYKMTSMTEIKLPSGLLEIGEGAFQGSGLIELTIPESVESVGSSIIGGCQNLETVYVFWNRGNRPSGWAYDWNQSGYSVEIVYGDEI